MEPITFHLANPEYKLNALTYCAQLPIGERISITIEKDKQVRSDKLNNSEHKWFRMIAQALNDAGYSVNDRQVIKLDVPFTDEIVKKYMFAKICKAMFDEERTSKLTNMQTAEAIEAMNQVLIDNWSISVEFPSNEGRL